MGAGNLDRKHKNLPPYNAGNGKNIQPMVPNTAKSTRHITDAGFPTKVRQQEEETFSTEQMQNMVKSHIPIRYHRRVWTKNMPPRRKR